MKTFASLVLYCRQYSDHLKIQIRTLNGSKSVYEFQLRRSKTDYISMHYTAVGLLAGNV